MHWIKCSFIAVTVCVAYCQDLVTETTITDLTIDPKENEINYENTNPIFQSILTDTPFQDLADNLTLKLKNETNSSKENAKITNPEKNVEANFKRDAENITFKNLKQLLFFPLFPFFLPPRREDESLVSKKDEFLIHTNATSKIHENPGEVKPFVFFDFAFIRHIPLNITNKANESKETGVKKINLSKSDENNDNANNNRIRRNTNMRMETPGFFDDSPLFPETELDEFLPKPDLFFSDTPFHHKPLKKLSRRKRDHKKSDPKNDLKMFFDTINDAFMQTKREFEQTDPIFNFLRGRGPQLQEEKKEDDDLFSQLPEIQEKPRMKWILQRNVKRINNNHNRGLGKSRESPMIILDRVVKIGEFHVHDDKKDKDSLDMKKKRDTNDWKKGLFGEDNHDEMAFSDLEETKKDETARKERTPTNMKETKIQSKEIRVLPQRNSSLIQIDTRSKHLKKSEDSAFQKLNSTQDKNLDKIIGSLETLLQQGFVKMSDQRLKRKSTSNNVDGSNLDIYSYDLIKKNISKFLNQIEELEKLNNVKLKEKPEANERKDTEDKKNLVFENEYLEEGKKEKQAADLNYFFLTVTLPTVSVFAFVLLVCFFSLQAKGKLCSRLFRPRQVFIVEGENPMQIKIPTGNKNYSKIQCI